MPYKSKKKYRDRRRIKKIKRTRKQNGGKLKKKIVIKSSISPSYINANINNGILNPDNSVFINNTNINDYIITVDASGYEIWLDTDGNQIPNDPTTGYPILVDASGTPLLDASNNPITRDKRKPPGYMEWFNFNINDNFNIIDDAFSKIYINKNFPNAIYPKVDKELNITIDN